MGYYGFTRVLNSNYISQEISDSISFKRSKSSSSIEWEEVNKFFRKFKTFILCKKYF